jgi:hypothetical protein
LSTGTNQPYTRWKGKNMEATGYEKWENPLSAACDCFFAIFIIVPNFTKGNERSL